MTAAHSSSPRGSIRRQLLYALLMASGLVLLCAVTGFVVSGLISLRQNLATHLTSLARATAENCAAPLAFGNPQDATDILASLRGEPHLEAAALFDREGKLFSRIARNTRGAALPARPEPPGYRFRRGAIEVFQPVVQAGNALGTLYLRSDLGAMTSRMQVYGVIALGVMVVSMLAGILFSNRLQGRISRPILALADTARVITQRKDYSVRAVTVGTGEIALLTEAFNGMLDEIQTRTEELHRLKDELELRVEERTAELTAANRELEAFSYSVSHDLRAPLRHMMSFAKLLERRLAERVDDKDKRYLSVINEAGERMEHLIDDLLTFSRLSRASLSKSNVNMRAVVDGALRELAPSMLGREIQWKIGPLPEVQADPVLLNTVMVNLLSNAIKYTRGRKPARIEVGVESDAHEHKFFVRDNGAGFDMKFVDKLFGVFQRLHRAEEFEGTGIGLASVRRIIQRHGGKTSAEGEVDRGATIYFTLPR